MSQLEIEDQVQTDLQRATGLAEAGSESSSRLNRVLQLTGESLAVFLSGLNPILSCKSAAVVGSCSDKCLGSHKTAQYPFQADFSFSLSCTNAVTSNSGYGFMVLQPTFRALGRHQLTKWSV